MALNGKTQLTFVFVPPPEQLAEGDCIFQSHVPWIAKTHHRNGEKDLLHYTVSKAPELKNPLNPSAGATENTYFILNEYYESDAGIADHFEQAQSNWQDFPALVQWTGKCKAMAPRPQVFNPLW